MTLTETSTNGNRRKAAKEAKPTLRVASIVIQVVAYVQDEDGDLTPIDVAPIEVHKKQFGVFDLTSLEAQLQAQMADG